MPDTQCFVEYRAEILEKEGRTLIFDSHAHYFDERFEKEAEGGAEQVLREVFASGVGRIVNVSTNMDNAMLCVGQAARYDGMYAAVGIHPEDAQMMGLHPEKELERLSAVLEQKEKHKVVALGEIGLDYHCERTDKNLQMNFFERQMVLAEKFSLPVIIHDRDAHGDCFDMIRRFPSVHGVFHSYSGSEEMARELVRRGWYISFSGVVTFKNAERVRRVAASVPVERTLVETDCPYLAPHPHRGELNRSDYLPFVIETLAHVHGAESEFIENATYANASVLFNIS